VNLTAIGWGCDDGNVYRLSSLGRFLADQRLTIDVSIIATATDKQVFTDILNGTICSY